MCVCDSCLHYAKRALRPWKTVEQRICVTWPECQDLPDSCLQLASKKPSPESIMVELLFPEQGHGPGPIFYQTFLRATPPLVKPDAPKHIIVHKKSLQRSTLLFRYRTTLCLFVTGQLFFFSLQHFLFVRACPFRYNFPFSVQTFRFVTARLFRFYSSFPLQVFFFVTALPFRYNFLLCRYNFSFFVTTFLFVTTHFFRYRSSCLLQRCLFVTALPFRCSFFFSLQLSFFVP